MKKVYITYCSCGKNQMIADKVFSTYDKAMLSLVKQYNPLLKGKALQDFANEDRTRKFFAHCIEEVEVDI
jgi:hypothetical protein